MVFQKLTPMMSKARPGNFLDQMITSMAKNVARAADLIILTLAMESHLCPSQNTKKADDYEWILQVMIY